MKVLSTSRACAEGALVGDSNARGIVRAERTGLRTECYYSRVVGMRDTH